MNLSEVKTLQINEYRYKQNFFAQLYKVARRGRGSGSCRLSYGTVAPGSILGPTPPERKVMGKAADKLNE